MRLLEYMRDRDLSDEAMAALINAKLSPARHVTPHAVKKWKYGEREPASPIMAVFEEVTEGRVTFDDWVSLALEISSRRAGAGA